MKNEKIENWDNFTGSKFLKAEDVESEEHAYAVIDLNVFQDDRSKEERLRLTLERKGKEYEFDLNKTNANFIQGAGISTPRHIVAKKLYFKKVKVNNPSTGQEVDGLRICKVE